jgi:hypothetical protein
VKTENAAEAQIERWRQAQGRHRAMTEDDVAELEDHLRAQMADLRAVGLDDEEAFLVAAKRLGQADAVSREFAQEHSDRLWQQLSLGEAAGAAGRAGRELFAVLALAAGAGLTVLGLTRWLDGGAVLARNLGFAVLPWLVAYFVWRRGARRADVVSVLGVAAALAAAVNLFPFAPGGSTEALTALHLPVALWGLAGVVYCGGWGLAGRRLMDFVRFSGELAIYYVLIALGGGVLVGLLVAAVSSLGHDLGWLVGDWVLPLGMPGALVVAAWLVDAKQGLIENIAPVLTKIFTPLTLVMLLAIVPVMVAAGDLVQIDRDDLMVFDAILMLVVALVLFAASARERLAPAGLFDWLQFALVAAALAVDAAVLAAMVGRIAEWGTSPNKLAALGLNVLLAAQLVGAGVLAARFGLRRAPFASLERWHTGYLPVYCLWAAVVALVFPLAFSFR